MTKNFCVASTVYFTKLQSKWQCVPLTWYFMVAKKYEES